MVAIRPSVVYHVNMSQSTRDYIFFADDRTTIPTSTMHIADQITKSNRVFWVNTYTRMPKVSEFTKAFRILTRRGARPAENQQDTGSPIISSTPIQFPWFGQPARKFNGYCAGRFFQKLVEQHNIQNPVLVTNFPCAVDAFRAIRKLAPQTTQIYCCVDDYTEYPGLNSKHWAEMENELLATVDGVTFTSRDLQQNKKRPESLPDLYLPHGVDYEHFAGEKTEVRPIEALEKLKKPIIGYYATMNTWADLPAIAYLAKRFPQCSFVVMGKALIPLTPIENIDNIHIFGQIPYSELPLYARYFDVGLIPYVQNVYIKAVQPLKLFEYYAAGLPVIATYLQNIEDIPGPLYLAHTHEDYGNHLNEILRSDLSELRRQAQEVAKQNSWVARAESFMQFVESCKRLFGN